MRNYVRLVAAANHLERELDRMYEEPWVSEVLVDMLGSPKMEEIQDMLGVLRKRIAEQERAAFEALKEQGVFAS